MLAVFVRIFKSGGVRYRTADETAQPSHPMQASEAVALKCVILRSVPLAAMPPLDLDRFEVGQIRASCASLNLGSKAPAFGGKR